MNTQEEIAPQIPAATEEDSVQTSTEGAAKTSASMADEAIKETNQTTNREAKF